MTQASGYYALKHGRAARSCIFMFWEDCEEHVRDYPWAEYQFFSDLNSAAAYLLYPWSSGEVAAAASAVSPPPRRGKTPAPGVVAPPPSRGYRPAVSRREGPGGGTGAAAAEAAAAAASEERVGPAPAPAPAPALGSPAAEPGDAGRPPKETGASEELEASDKPAAKGRRRRPRKSISEAWERKYEQLREYREKHGTCNVARKRDAALYFWVRNQRYYFKQLRERERTDISEEKVRRLEGLGFDFDFVASDERWEEMFARLEEYKEKHGTCNVTGKEDRKLKIWVQSQRRNYKHFHQGEGKRTATNEARIKRLEDLGFCFVQANRRSKDEPSEAGAADAHTPAPAPAPGHPSSEPADAGRPPEKLEASAKPAAGRGSAISLQKRMLTTWEKKFAQLREYREKHGTCDVVGEEHMALQRWTTRQRYAYRWLLEGKKTDMTNERVKRLEGLGFVFDLGVKRKKHKTWEIMFAQLKEYREKHGTCNVVGEEHSELQQWTLRQRYAYKWLLEGKKANVSNEKLKRLEDLGLNFGVSTAATAATMCWEEMFTQLKEYKEEHGTCDVTGEGHSKLHQWTIQQRHKYRRFRQGRGTAAWEVKIKRLEELGFGFGKANTRWEEMFTMLKEYKEKHGTCKVVGEEHLKLRHWVIQQRYKHNNLRERGRTSTALWDMKVKRLKDLGLDLGKSIYVRCEYGRRARRTNKTNRTNSWEEMFEKLVHYKAKTGSCSVGQEDEANEELRLWLIRQEAQYKRLQEGKMSLISDKKVCRMKELGYLFQNCTWAERMEQLRQFKEENNSFDVPPNHPVLGKWVRRMRLQLRKFFRGKPASITREQVNELSMLGFHTGKIESGSDWEEMFEKLRQYKARTGSCSVEEDDEANKDLRLWLIGQEMQFKCLQEGKKSSLTDEKAYRLQELGLELQESYTWEERMLQLRRFKEETGNLAIPPDHPVLGKWATKIRLQLRHFSEGTTASLITTERAEQLYALGLQPTKRQKGIDKEKESSHFEEMFEALCRFKQEHGHCNVPYFQNPSLAPTYIDLSKWVRIQRVEYKKLKNGKDSLLTAGRLQRLHDLGFLFQKGMSFKSWGDRMKQLREYKEKHGHLNIPVAHPELGPFVNFQRSEYRKYENREPTSMTAERIRELTKIGFIFSAGKRTGPRTAKNKTWEERFQDLLEFKKEYGHTMVPQYYYTGLGSWVFSQRKEYKKLKEGRPSFMTAEKALKLTEVGFVFRSRNCGKRRSTDVSDDASGQERGPTIHTHGQTLHHSSNM